MKYNPLLVLIFLFCSFASVGQLNQRISDKILNKSKKNIQDSIILLKTSIAFIKQIKGEQLNNSAFILKDTSFDLIFFNCLAELQADTKTYSRKELKQIQKQNVPTHWTKDMFPNIKVINTDSLDNVYKGNPVEWWRYYYKNIGNCYNSFSNPIFLRNYTYCLFYSHSACGDLNGSGELVLYKKSKGKWVKVKTYCSWIS